MQCSPASQSRGRQSYEAYPPLKPDGCDRITATLEGAVRVKERRKDKRRLQEKTPERRHTGGMPGK